MKHLDYLCTFYLILQWAGYAFCGQRIPDNCPFALIGPGMSV